MVIDPDDESQAHLFHVVDAGRALSAGLGFGQRRQQQRGENRDDRDHDEQFDQGECTAFSVEVFHGSVWVQQDVT